jgi:hypothetical protein
VEQNSSAPQSSEVELQVCADTKEANEAMAMMKRDMWSFMVVLSLDVCLFYFMSDRMDGTKQIL